MIRFVLVLCFAVVGACSKKESAATDLGPATASVIGSGGIPAPSSSWAAMREERRHRCPTEVQGATSTAVDVDGGVALTVTASDGAAVAEIRARGLRIVEASQRFADTPARAVPDHHGRCAALVRGAKSGATDVDGGTQITILANNAADVGRIRADVRERLGHP